MWKKDKEKTKTVSDRPRRKIGFRELARYMTDIYSPVICEKMLCILHRKISRNTLYTV